MTVAHLEATMPNHEFLRWQVYLGRRAQHEHIEQFKAKHRAKHQARARGGHR